MDACDIILRPIVAEKSMNSVDGKKYTSDVLVSAIKTQARNAVEKIFGVEVKNVNIMNARGKEKRAGRYTGKTVRRRKVIVTLTEDSNDIKIFNDNKENQ